MTFVKIVELVRPYPMPFTACLYLASFLRSLGGGYPPLPVGTKVARTPVGARVNSQTLSSARVKEKFRKTHLQKI